MLSAKACAPGIIETQLLSEVEAAALAVNAAMLADSPPAVATPTVSGQPSSAGYLACPY